LTDSHAVARCADRMRLRVAALRSTDVSLAADLQSVAEALVAISIRQSLLARALLSQHAKYGLMPRDWNALVMLGNEYPEPTEPEPEVPS
jgi:hypothetical protein